MSLSENATENGETFSCHKPRAAISWKKVIERYIAFFLSKKSLNLINLNLVAFFFRFEI